MNLKEKLLTVKTRKRQRTQFQSRDAMRQHFETLVHPITELMKLLEAPNVEFIQGENAQATSGQISGLGTIRVVYDMFGNPLCAEIIEDED